MTGAVFVDLRKAFDTVDHARLLSKLTIYGIRNEELLWFEDYLFNRTQFVAFDGIESLVQPISRGVPQGSILGPLLLVPLINDIDIHMKCCEIILYADDTVIYYEEQLNHVMEQISNWFVQKQLGNESQAFKDGVCPLWYSSQNLEIKTNRNKSRRNQNCAITSV